MVLFRRSMIFDSLLGIELVGSVYGGQFFLGRFDAHHAIGIVGISSLTAAPSRLRKSEKC